MITLEQAKRDKLTRIEASLLAQGCVKCKGCNFWVDKEFINKDSICNVCEVIKN